MAFLLLLSFASCLLAQPEGDFLIPNFKFQSGESIPSLKIHYRTLGTPRRDFNGRIQNAVLVLHGTGGSGKGFLREQWAGQLYGPGQPLDTTKFYVVMPDAIGHGESSKPSDGLRTKFPHYNYNDMITAVRRLLKHRLSVDRLRLIIGTSMGCMHAWMWGGLFPDEVDTMMPLACQATPITGRNLMWRKMVVDLVRSDPAYRNGNYTDQPPGLKGALYIQMLMGGNPIEMQALGATRAAAEAEFEKRAREMAARKYDANDYIYQIESSRDYDPQLDKVIARVTAINFADDEINPPELGIFEREAAKAPNARTILWPASAKTRGHSTHSMPVFWKQHLDDLLSAKP